MPSIIAALEDHIKRDCVIILLQVQSDSVLFRIVPIKRPRHLAGLSKVNGSDRFLPALEGGLADSRLSPDKSYPCHCGILVSKLRHQEREHFPRSIGTTHLIQQR